ncbi:MAG: ankyrin repeat domain-containing protein [Chlamydiae bacterium]|nr:ankyrin repeat domain-containing protein [Chlamydiota bacterium]
MRDRFSRHYADTAALANHPEATKAIDRHDLRDRVVSWKNLFFRDSWASYTEAQPGTFRLVPRAERLPELRRDYQLMHDMYLIEPINFDEILNTLSELEHRINLTTPLLSLGEALVKQKEKELVQSVTKILSIGANVNDTSWKGHRPLQLLIKAKLESRKKLELVKHLVSLGADIHSADKSGLTPYQVAISEKNKPISDLLRSKGARPMSPPGTGYAQH